MVEMSDESKENISDLEAKMRFSTGIGRVTRGECPVRAVTPIGCMFCSYGHMLECHYPQICVDAECYHYQQMMGAETFGPGWGEDGEPMAP